MLQKAGWKEGSGLGTSGAGIVAPINKFSYEAILVLCSSHFALHSGDGSHLTSRVWGLSCLEKLKKMMTLSKHTESV